MDNISTAFLGQRHHHKLVLDISLVLQVMGDLYVVVCYKVAEDFCLVFQESVVFFFSGAAGAPSCRVTDVVQNIRLVRCVFSYCVGVSDHHPFILLCSRSRGYVFRVHRVARKH